MKPLFFRAMAAVATVRSIALFGLCAGTAQAQQQRTPNILFILADNIGYGDIGVYSSGALRRGAIYTDKTPLWTQRNLVCAP